MTMKDFGIHWKCSQIPGWKSQDFPLNKTDYYKFDISMEKYEEKKA